MDRSDGKESEISLWETVPLHLRICGWLQLEKGKKRPEGGANLAGGESLACLGGLGRKNRSLGNDTSTGKKGSAMKEEGKMQDVGAWT